VRFELFNGDYVGTVEWRDEGEVALDVPDETQRRFFERHFSKEESFMSGAVDQAGMSLERGDSSEPAFVRAVERLAAYHYRATPAPSEHASAGAHNGGRSPA
jgi:hypothetical protein